MIPALNGLVLSGGLSTRMGSDKGNIHFYDKTQRQHVFDMLSPFCKEVFISCNQQQAAETSKLPVITDRYLNLGPLNGILSAFQAKPDVAWLVVACDLPFLTTVSIQHLIQQRDSSKVATAFWNVKRQFPEPLVAIWEPAALSVINEFVKQGIISPGKILKQSDTCFLNIADTGLFRNINTPDEYLQALQHIQSGKTSSNPG